MYNCDSLSTWLGWAVAAQRLSPSGMSSAWGLSSDLPLAMTMHQDYTRICTGGGAWLPPVPDHLIRCLNGLSQVSMLNSPWPSRTLGEVNLVV